MDSIDLIYPKKGKLIDSLENEPLSKEFLQKLKTAKKISNQFLSGKLYTKGGSGEGIEKIWYTGDAFISVFLEISYHYESDIDFSMFSPNICVL